MLKITALCEDCFDELENADSLALKRDLDKAFDDNEEALKQALWESELDPWQRNFCP